MYCELLAFESSRLRPLPLLWPPLRLLRLLVRLLERLPRRLLERLSRRRLLVRLRERLSRRFLERLLLLGLSSLRSPPPWSAAAPLGSFLGSLTFFASCSSSRTAFRWPHSYAIRNLDSQA